MKQHWKSPREYDHLYYRFKVPRADGIDTTVTVDANDAAAALARFGRPEVMRLVRSASLDYDAECAAGTRSGFIRRCLYELLSQGATAN